MSRKKIYYPEGQIQKGLYTEGKEWMLEDGTEYIGDYHTYYSGEVFTRSSFLKNVSKKLIPYINLEELSQKETYEYEKLTSIKSDKYIFAQYGLTPPKESDYSNGFFNRYFLKRHFQDIITEVTKSTFENAKSEYYIAIKIPWKITGPLRDSGITKGVLDTNQRLVLLMEKDMVGISTYITDYTEYARISS